jgi:hypothetical protein
MLASLSHGMVAANFTQGFIYPGAEKTVFENLQS